MNERIQELMKQSMVEYQFDMRFSPEKFAELIVAEMLQTCEDHPGWSGRMIGEQIKEHFGVEE